MEVRMQDLTAEYQNYRRRTVSVRSDAYESGQADAALALLPVYDNLVRALEQPSEDEAFVAGIRMTLRTMTEALASLGITEIPALGQPFDSTLHEALEHVEDPDAGENTIVRVALTGFRRGGQILRHALVIVAN